MSLKPPDLFVDWIRKQLPEAVEIEVSPFGATSSGSSNDTKLFTLSCKNPDPMTERLVLRKIPAGRGLFPKYDLHLQASVMRALAGTKLPVPVVRWYEQDPAVMGSPFMVMEHIEGSIPSDSPPGFHGHGLFFDASLDRRAAMWWAVLEQMAMLHSLDWRALELPRLTGMSETVGGSMTRQIEHLEHWLAWAKAGPIPLIDRGLQWLRDTPAKATRLSLLWGDARPGNVIYRNDQVVAVLDWELATVGRPEFDLCYFMWQAEVTAEVNDMKRLIGLPDQASTFARYETLSGHKIQDPAHAEMFALVRLAVMIALGVRASVNQKQSRSYLMNNVVMRRLESLLS